MGKKERKKRGKKKSAPFKNFWIRHWSASTWGYDDVARQLLIRSSAPLPAVDLLLLRILASRWSRTRPVSTVNSTTRSRRRPENLQAKLLRSTRSSTHKKKSQTILEAAYEQEYFSHLWGAIGNPTHSGRNFVRVHRSKHNPRRARTRCRACDGRDVRPDDKEGPPRCVIYSQTSPTCTS